MLFDCRNRIRFGYSRWGLTRGGGKIWHGGATESHGVRQTFCIY